MVGQVEYIFLLVNTSSSFIFPSVQVIGHTNSVGFRGFLILMRRRLRGKRLANSRCKISLQRPVWLDEGLNLYWEERPPALAFISSHPFPVTKSFKSQCAHIRVWSQDSGVRESTSTSGISLQPAFALDEKYLGVLCYLVSWRFRTAAVVTYRASVSFVYLPKNPWKQR